ncbi:MAG: FG-GAP-like repeat-containing protein [Deltaproteobacteria bacterium]|nr:FG-GAP-like repeat-containing protein [Deltaproteobacteria bacterium]
MRHLSSAFMFLLVVLLPLTGCKCGKGGKEPVINITSPTEAQVITLDDDVDPSRVGIQIPVEATVENVEDGSGASVIVNEDANLAVPGFVVGTTISFPAVTVVGDPADGLARITVSVRDRESELAANDTVTVAVERPVTLDCAFVQPVADSTLGEADDADPGTRGFQHDVVVQCSEDLTGTPANLTIDGRGLPSVVFAGPTTTFPSVTFSEGANLLVATVTAAAGSWSDQVRVIVDTPSCEVRLSPEGAVVFNLDGDTPRLPGRTAVPDEDGNAANGIQALLGATTPDCQGGQAVLMVEGADLATVDVTTTSVDFGAVTLPDGEAVRVQVEVRPAGAGSPSGLSAPVDYHVDSLRPAPVMLFPTSGILLGLASDKDGDATNGIQIDVTVEAPGLEVTPDPQQPERSAEIDLLLTNLDTGATATASCVVGVDGCVDPTNANRYLLEVTLDADGAWSTEVAIGDPAGNVGTDGPVEFVLSTGSEQVTIAAPAAGALVNRASSGVTDTTVPVDVSAPGLPAGSAVSVVCTGASGTGAGSLGAAGTARVEVTFASLPCEGALATCTATIDVGGTGLDSAPVSFTVDISPPAITIALPQDGATLYDTSVAVEVVTTCLEDGQIVSVSTDTGLSGSGSVASDGTLLALNLPSGAHVLTASAADVAGNAVSSSPVSVTIDANPPQVVFVQPSDGLFLTLADDVAAAPGFQYDVTVQVPNKPAGASVVLQIGYDDGGTFVYRAPIGPVATNASLRAIFPAVDLPQGPHRLRAVATSVSGLTGERSINVTVSTGVVTCNLVQPIDGASLGAPADQNADLSDGVQADVRVRTSAADGATVELSLTDPSGATTTSTGTASGGELVFSGVTFSTDAAGNHGTNLLEATCDVGGVDEAPALSTTVEVDLEAPVAVISSPADGKTFNLTDADASAAAGFQIAFVGTASDPSTGSSVKAGSAGSLEVSCGGAAPTVLPVTFGVFGTQIEARVRPTLDDQTTCTLTFTATDQAGNVSTPATVSVSVDRLAPTVAFPGILTGRIFNDGDDTSGTAGFQRNVRVSFSGVGTAGSVALLVTNTFGDTGATGWSRKPAEGSPISPAAAAVDHIFNGTTLTLGDTDTVSLVAVATDPAGNITESSVTVTVDRGAPVVSITRPDPTSLPPCFNVFDDLNGTLAGLQLQVDVSTVGVEDGLPLSLCTSVDPGSGLGSCQGNPSAFVIDESTVSGNVAVFLPATLADGVQTLQAEVRDRAGNYSSSAPLALCADTTPPDVLTFVADTDTMAPSGSINALELAGSGGQVCLTLTAVDADGQVARIETNNPAAGTLVGTATVSGGTATICGTLAQGGHALVATVYDAAGNPNRSVNPPLSDPQAQLPLIVDTVAPTIAISGPAGSNLNAAGDAIPATADYDFTYAVVSNAEDGQTVTFLVDGSTVGTATLSGGAASLAGQSLTQGSHQLRVQVQDAVGNPANTERAVTVDTLPPTVSILSPAGGTTLNVGSVDFQIQVAGAATGNPLILVDQGTGGTLANRTVAASQPQTEAVSLSDATYDVRAEVTDTAGNVGVSSPVQITVDTLGCSIRWLDPASANVTFVVSDDEQPGTAGLQTTVTASTSDCAGRDIELWVSGSLVTTVASDAGTGNASFLLGLADGATGVPVMARIVDAASNVTTSTFDASVDVTAPGLTRTAPVGAAFTFVSATNRYLAAGTWMGTTVVQDGIAGGNLEADFTFEVTGAIGGTLRLLFGGADLVSAVSITSSPQTVSLVDVVIAQDSVGDLTARVTDAAGNTIEDIVPITVDVQAPAAPAVSSSLTDNRAATVELTWTDTGDDGNSGTAAAYSLSWEHAAIANETDFDGAHPFTVGFAPGAPGTGQSLALTPLPPINSYWIALRAEDEVGNRSPLVNVVTEANPWTVTNLMGEGGNFPWQMAGIGDVNNDGHPDFAASAVTLRVSGANAAGATYVYYGGAAYSAQDARRQRLSPGLAGDLFGMHLASGDVSGDGIPDLIVGASGYGANRGRVRIYFGQDRSGTDCSADFSLCWLNAADFVELRGATGVGEFGKMVGAPADFRQVADATPDGRAELIVGAPGAASARGRAYVFAGRTKAAWQVAQTATDDGGVTFYVPVTLAELTLEGGAVDDIFGYRWGVTGLGDLDGDGAEELTLPASTIATTYVYDGASLGAASGTVSATTGTLTTLTGATSGSTTASQKANALGNRAVSAFVTGAATPELILADADHRRVRIYPTSAAGVGALLTTLRVPVGQAVANWGFDLAVGDLNLDGRPDLAVGSNNATTPSGAGIYFNTGSGTHYPLYPDTELLSASLAAVGLSVDIGDYNGDGRPDLLVADLVSTPTNGTIIVYHD